MDTDTTAVARRIRALRVAQGLSLQQLADRVGVSKPQIDKLEKGTRRLTPDWIARIAGGLGVEPRHLAEQVDTRPVVSRQETQGVSSRPEADTVVQREVDTNGDPEPMRLDTVETEEPRPAGVPRNSSDLPLRGFGRFVASEGRQVGFFVGADAAPEQVWRPIPLKGVAEAYAVRMPDGSMMPKYDPGQVLFVHPYRTPRCGDTVVIRLVGNRFVVGRLVEIGEGVVFERLEPRGTSRIGVGQVVAIDRIILAEEA